MTRAKTYPDTDLGARLKALREEMGLTQPELAARAGVSYRALVYYEAGSVQPVWPVVIALAKALGATPNDLLPG